MYAKCPTCGDEFNRLVLSVCRKELFRQRECGECLAKRERERLAIENKSRRAALDQRWASFCPPRYQESHPKDLAVNRQLISRVMRWRPASEGRGIGLVGQPRIGKRRALFLLAKDLFFAGIRLAQTGALEFDRLTSSDQFDDELRSRAISRIRQIRRAQVLIFSDLGTEKLTERGQVELYSLIDFRAQNLLPILWTTQFSAEQLAAKFYSSKREGELARERGRAAIGRLNHCSDVIQIEREFARNILTPEAQVLSA